MILNNNYYILFDFGCYTSLLNEIVTVGILHNHAYTYLFIFHEYKHTYIHI